MQVSLSTCCFPSSGRGFHCPSHHSAPVAGTCFPPPLGARARHLVLCLMVTTTSPGPAGRDQPSWELKKLKFAKIKSYPRATQCPPSMTCGCWLTVCLLILPQFPQCWEHLLLCPGSQLLAHIGSTGDTLSWGRDGMRRRGPRACYTTAGHCWTLSGGSSES